VDPILVFEKWYSRWTVVSLEYLVLINLLDGEKYGNELFYLAKEKISSEIKRGRFKRRNTQHAYTILISQLFK